MATPNRAAYLTALLNQKKQNEYQGGNVVNQGSSDQISETGSQSHSNGKNQFQKVMGGIDNIGYRMGKGLFSFLEGFADLGANAIGALGDVTGWYDSKPYTDWAKHDMSDQAMKWAMTYGDMNPISIGKKAVEGKYVDGDYWGNLWGDLGNIFTGQDDGKFEEDFKKNYQYDFDDNFMTNNGVGQFVGDMAESFGRMVPSIALGKFAGGIAEKAALKAGNIIGAAEKAEKVGKLVSTAMIGASSAGSSSVEALNDGANAGQAILYGLASGAVEAGTEYIPWEIVPGLGKLIGKNTLPGIGLRKFSISELGKSMAQEGLEEVVSGVFNPILKTIYKGADSLKEFGNKDFYIDLGKSFASGALMGGLMEGVSMKANSSKYSNEGIDYINKGTEWYGEYMKEVDAFSKLDGRYANGEINSIQYEDGCEEIAGKLKEISQKGEEIGKLWDKVPEGKKDAVREFFSDPQKYAEEMRETTNRVEMDSNKPIGNVGGVQEQTQAQPSNNVTNEAQSQGNVENGQTQPYQMPFADNEQNDLLKPIISKLDTLDENFIKLYRLENETIASTKQDIINFYNGSIDGTIKDGRLIFGRISETNANDIKNDTNIDVKGYSVTLDSSYIKHIDKRHIQNSAKRIPLAVDDLSLIPTIISDYDSIESKIFDNGEKQLVFKKKIGNEYLVATMVSNRKKRLIVQSLYITKKESGGTQPRHVSFEALRSTSETRTGDTDSSTNNVNENRTAVNTDAGDERTKAYRKAEETYQSNQQLLKDAAPNKKVNLKTATDYANAEASLVESYLNSNVDSDISVKFSSKGEQGKRYSAGVDTSLSRDSAISTLDAQFEDSLKNATVKQRGGKTQKLTDFVDSETLDEIRGIAHSLHEQLVDGADDSKIAKTREMFERKTAYLRERLSNTIDMAKEVDRFNKNAELTKRQFKIDQSKYADESAADGTIRQIAKSLPRYNILLKDGRRASDNSGLSLAKKSYAKWANDAYATLKGIYDNGQLVNFDAERADALFGDLDLIANGGDQSSKSMTLEQVKAMTRVMKALRFQISDQANKKRVELRSRATSINSEVSYMNEALGKDPGKANGRIRAFANEQVKLSNAGDILMGYDGSGLQKEMDAVVESKWKYYDDYYAMKEKYLPEKSAEIKSLTKELSSKVTINGEKVTKGEVLDAYLMFSDAETKSLMDNARKTDTRKIRIGKATMEYDPSSTYEELGKILGDDLIERGKKVFTSFYNDHSENSYLNKLRDYQLKTSGDTTVADNKTDYYPRGQASESTTRTNSIEALEKNASGITAKNGNVTKSRQAAQAMVVLEATDPFTRMQDYMSQVSSEMNLRNQSNDFLRLLGLNVTGEDGKTTRLQSSLGAEGTRMLRDFITAANGNELVRSDALLTKMQALSVNATLGFSPINPLKNFLSLFKEGHEVGFSNVMKVIANPTKWVNKELIGAIKNTGVWKARYDDVASMAANADLKGKIGKIGQKMTALYSTFDQATSLMVAQVDLEYVKSAHPEMSASEQIKEAVRLWQTDVNKTQSTAEKMSKSQSSLGRFMGGDSQIAKGLWTFQSDTVAGASMLVKDISQFQSSSKLIKWAKGVIADANASEAKVSYAKDVLTKATATRNAIIKRRLPAGVAATLIGACLKYLIEDLSQRVRGKKRWDESPIDGDTVVDVLNNGLGSVVPFYETIMSAMKYNEGKVELYGLSALSSLLKGLGEFGKGTPRTALIDTVTAASSLAGIPLKNIYDYTVGAFSSFDPKLAVDTKNLLYASEKASTSYKSNFNMALYERVGDVSGDVKVELRTLSDSGYDIKPSGVATTYKNDKGDDVTISWTSKQEMRKYYQKANARLAKTVKTDYYRSLSDEEKAQAIKKLYSSYREASLAKVVTKKAPANAASALAYANYKDLGTLLSAVAHISSLEATKTMSRKQRAIAYVNSLKGLSKAQRMAILQMAGYTVDSKYLGQLLRESGMDNKTIKEVTSA